MVILLIVVALLILSSCGGANRTADFEDEYPISPAERAQIAKAAAQIRKTTSKEKT